MAYSLDVDRVAPPPQTAESVFLWGAPRSGKSGFAGSLYGLGLSDRTTARWTAHPRDALDEHTHEELKRAYRDLQQLGYRKTDVRTPAPLKLIVRKRTKDRELDAITLSLVDPAGEWVTDAGHRASFDGIDVHRRAAQSNGLIWLVEPVDTPIARSRTQAELLPQLIALLEASGGKQIGIPVAICLSMVDRLSSVERERALADARTVLGELLGESVTRWFEALCPEHRYFAISSAGLSPGAVDPINISEVLDWVVSRGRVAVRERSGTSISLARSPGLALRTGILALAGLAGFGTYTVLRRIPSPATSSGEVSAPLDTSVKRAPAPVPEVAKRAPVPEVREQGGAAQPSDSAGATEAFRRLARASAPS